MAKGIILTFPKPFGSKCGYNGWKVFNRDIPVFACLKVIHG